MRKCICNSALIFTVLVVFIFAGISFVLAFDDCAYAETETYFSAERYTDSDFLLNSDGSESNKTIADFAYEVKYTPNENPITELACVIPLQYLESQEEEAVFFYNGNGQGKQYVDENMNGGVWDIDAGNSTLYAHYARSDCMIKLIAVRYSVFTK